MITAIEIGGDGERMHLHRRPLHAAAWLGLHRKPLDAAIGQILALYCPGGHQDDNQLNDDATCAHFVGRFDGHRDAAVLYRTHRPMEEVRGFHKSH